MAFPEKLYSLRKKHGLSQEELAQELNVSRQAISKWESGQSTPESEKLLIISEYFQVSLDYLLKDGPMESSPAPQSEESTPPLRLHIHWLPGMVLLLAGVICLVLWGIISILSPSVSAKLAASSAIHIDGNGIWLALSLAAILIGMGLLLKGTKP